MAGEIDEEDPDILPASSNDRASTSIESPDFQLPSEENTVDDAARSARASADVSDDQPEEQPSEIRVPTDNAQYSAPEPEEPASPKPTKRSPRQVGQIEQPQEPQILHTPFVDPGLEAQAQARDQQKAAKQMGQQAQAANQQASAVEASDPYQSEDGRWKKQKVDPLTGAINEHDVIDSGMGKIDRTTGNIYAQTANGPIQVGVDPTTQAIARTVSDKAAAAAQGSQATVAIAAAKQELISTAKQLSAFNGVPQRMQTQIGKLTAAAAQNPDDSDAQDQLTQATDEFSKWKASNPLYTTNILKQNQLKDQIQQLSAAKVTAAAQVSNAVTAKQYVQANGNLPPGYGAQADVSQDQSDVSLPATFQRAGEIQAQTGLPWHLAQASAISEAKKNGAKTIGGVPIDQSLAGIDVSKSLPQMTPAQLRQAVSSGLISKDRMQKTLKSQLAARDEAAKDNGVGPMVDFGARVLAKNSEMLNRAGEGISRFVAGDSDLTNWFKQNAEGMAQLGRGEWGWVNPKRNDTIGASVANAFGTVLSTVPATTATTLLLPESIGTAAVGWVARAGLMSVRAIPIATQFAASSSAEAFDQAKQQGASDKDATAAAGHAALRTLYTLPAYMLGGAAAGAAERALLPALITPVARGAAHFILNGAANVAASTAVRAVSGESIATTKDSIAQDLAFALEPSVHAIREQGHTNAFVPVAQDIAAGTDPHFQQYQRMANDTSVAPDARQKAAAFAAKMQVEAKAFLKKVKAQEIAPGARNDPEAQNVFDLNQRATELRAKIQTAFNGGTAQAHTDLADHMGELQTTEGALHDATRAMIARVSPEMQTRIARLVDPKSDWTATSAANSESELTHFGSENIGAAVRDTMSPDQQRSVRQLAIANKVNPDIADHIANQALGAKAIRDLSTVARGGKVAPEDAATLKALGFLQSGDAKNPSAPLHVTEDALHLLPKGVQDMVRSRPDAARYSPAADNVHGNLLYQHAAAGMDNFARTAGKMTPAPAPEPAPVTSAPAAGSADLQPSVGKTNLGDVLAKAGVETPERSRDDIVKEIKQRANELAKEKNPDLQKALQGRIQELNEQLNEAPVKSASGERIDESKLTPSQQRLVGDVRKEWARNKALFDALGVNTPSLEGAPGTSGLHMGDEGELTLDPRSMEEDLRRATGPDGNPMTEIERQSLLRARMREELTHRIQILAEGKEWRKTYKDLWNDPDLDPALKEMARRAYVGFDKLSDEAKAAEAVRMVLDGRWHGTITERIFRAIEGIVRYMRGLNVEASRSQLFKDIIGRAEKFREELKAKESERESENGTVATPEAIATEGDTIEPFPRPEPIGERAEPGASDEHPKSSEPAVAHEDETGAGERGAVPEGASTDFLPPTDEGEKPAPVRKLTKAQQAESDRLQKEHEESLSHEPLMRGEGFMPLREAVARLGGLPSKKHELRGKYGEELDRVQDALQKHAGRVQAGAGDAHFNLFRRNADSPDRIADRLGFKEGGANAMFEALERELTGGGTHWVNPESSAHEDYGQETGLRASKSKDTGTPDMFGAPQGEMQLNEDALKKAPERQKNIAATWQRLTAKMRNGETLSQGEETAYRFAEKELGQGQLFDPSEDKGSEKKRQVAEILRRQNARLKGDALTQSNTDLFTGKPETNKKGQGSLFASPSGESPEDIARASGIEYQGATNGLHAFKELTTGGNFSIPEKGLTRDNVQRVRDAMVKSFDGTPEVGSATSEDIDRMIAEARAKRGLAASPTGEDTGRPEDGSTPGERLAREAEQAGVVLKPDDMKALMRNDQETMKRLRARIQTNTGKQARFQPDDPESGGGYGVKMVFENGKWTDKTKILSSLELKSILSEKKPLFFRLHSYEMNGRLADEFNSDNAFSSDIGANDEPQRGYSSFDNPKDLIHYWSGEEGPAYRSAEDDRKVVIFSGDKEKNGTDGELLVVPDGKSAHWTTLGDLKNSLNLKSGFQPDEKTLLFRASDNPESKAGAHFSENENDARAYQDNQGFGGKNLHKYKVDSSRVAEVLSLRDLANHLEPLLSETQHEWAEENGGLERAMRDNGYTHVFHALENSFGPRRNRIDPIELLKKDHDWIRFDDDFPEGAKTWRYIGKDTLVPIKAASFQPEEESGPFYSQLVEATKKIPQAMMTVGQARSAIEKGAKPDEVRMSGILTDPLSPMFGRDQNEKVSRDALQSYALERQAKVEDVTLGGIEKPEIRYDPELEMWRFWKNGKFRYGFDTKKEAQDFISEGLHEFADKRETHFDKYQLPGAEPGTYREQFVTWPQKKGTTQDEATAKLKVITDAAMKRGGFTSEELKEADRLSKIAQNVRGKEEWPSPENWEDGHSQYSSIANPVVRIRRNIRTDSNGNKTLFLEEIQGPNPDNQEKMPPELRKRIYEIGMKRAIREAADEGATHLGWTTGETQADRYSLEKHLREVKATQSTDGQFHIKATGINGEPVTAKYFDAEELPNVVGKDLADKIMADAHENPTTSEDKKFSKTYSGLDLKVGGEGLKSRYDVTLSRIANEIGKKFGVKTGKASLEKNNNFGDWFKENHGDIADYDSAQIRAARGEFEASSPRSTESGGNEIHSIEIPESLRTKAISEGFPLFASKASPVDETVYHSTEHPGNLESEGIERGAATPGSLGIYTTPEREYAQGWGGDNASVRKMRVQMANPLDLRDIPLAKVFTRAQLVEEMNRRGLDITDADLPTGQTKLPFDEWKPEIEALTNKMQAAGFDGFSTKVETGGKEYTEHVPFDPSALTPVEEPKGRLHAVQLPSGQIITGQDHESARDLAGRISADASRARNGFIDAAGKFTPEEEPLAASPAAIIGAHINSATDRIADEWKARGSKNNIAARGDAVGTRANITAGQAATTIRLDIPDAKDRAAMPFIIEAGTDPSERMARLQEERQKILNAPAKLSAKWLPVIDRAISEESRLSPLRANYDRIMAAHLSEQKREGVAPGEVQDYVTRRLNAPETADEQKPLFDMGNGGTSRYYTKGRVFETLGDAIEKGYDPKSTDLADLTQHRLEAGEKVLGQKRMFDALRGTPSPVDGLPIIGKEEERPTIASKAAELEYRTQLDDWVTGGKQGPPPRQPVTPTAVPKGYQTVNAGGTRLIVHDAEAPIFKDLFGDSAIRRHWAGRLALKAAAGVKAYTLMGDTFHAGRMLYKMAAAGGGGPVKMVDGKPVWNLGRGKALIEYNDADLSRAVTAGEVTQDDADYAKSRRKDFDSLIASGMNVGKFADNLVEQAHANVPGFNRITKWIFEKLSRSAMVQSAMNNLDRNRSNPRYTEEQAMRQTAKEMNETFGNLGNQGIFKDKTLQDLSRLLLLAPQWTESQFRSEARAYGQAGKSVLDAATGKGFRTGNSTRIFAAGFVAMLAVNQVINYITRGQSTFQNKEDGEKFSAFVPGGRRGFFFDPLEIAGQYAWAANRYIGQHMSPVDAATRIASNKLSPLARAAKEAITGRGYDDKHFLSDTDRYRSAASNLLPVPIGAGGFVERDPRQPLGFRANRQPGSIQKQLMSSVGLKMDPAQSPTSAISNLAQPFRASRHGGDTTGEFSQLRRALDDRNGSAARDEIEWLIGQGKTTEAIEHAVGIKKDGTIGPELFTGNKDAEAQFMKSLTPDHRDLYKQAQQDHLINARMLKGLMLGVRRKRLASRP